jgi:hypothetical protein
MHGYTKQNMQDKLKAEDTATPTKEDMEEQ